MAKPMTSDQQQIEVTLETIVMRQSKVNRANNKQASSFPGEMLPLTKKSLFLF